MFHDRSTHAAIPRAGKQRPENRAKYTYDGAGNIIKILNSYFSNETLDLTYDGVDRLSTASGPWGSGSIDYNGAGNIQSQRFGSYLISYTYSPSTKRLTSISGSRAMTFGYDQWGNVTSNGSSTFAFDLASQMTCANCGTPNEMKYGYDGQGRRVFEERSGRKTYFIQAPNGDLQFEYTPWGKTWVKHAYLHGKRVATETDSDALATSTSLSASPASPISYGQQTTLTATVSPAATGSVEFRDGAQVLGVSTLSAGAASLAVTSLSVGTHSLTANYLGDTNYRASSGSLSLVVNKRNSLVSLSASPSSGPLGQQVSLSATVTGTSPAGQVRFNDGATVLGTVNLSGAGTAQLTTPALAAGSHVFTAEYLGDANHNGATSNGATSTIAQGSASVSLSSSNANSVFGQSVTFTATVNGLAALTPTGSVTFRDGTTALATVGLVNGSATFATSSLSVGSHSISAAYAGDGNYPPATSASLTQQVKAASSVTLDVPPSPLLAGSWVALTATVTGAAPSGVVEFFDGGVLIGQATFANGTASLNVLLGGGDRVLKAIYLGDATNASSTSAEVPRFVNIWPVMGPILEVLD